jgi:hypothetical protein
VAQDVSRPLTRGELNRVLIVNALTRTWPNVLVPAAIAAVGLLLGLPLVTLAVAVAAWLVLSAITYFDEDEAAKVADRLRQRRRAQLKRATGAELQSLSPPIAAHMRAVLAQEERIRDAIDRAELPFTEVSEEVDTFVRAAERAAGRAELLYEFLAEQNRDVVAARLEQLRAEGRSDASSRALMDALAEQIRALDRAWDKLNAFYTEMERIEVELGNVRGQLLSVSAASEADAQRQLASGVRDLREQVGAVAEGMSEALEETGGPAP